MGKQSKSKAKRKVLKLLPGVIDRITAPAVESKICVHPMGGGIGLYVIDIFEMMSAAVDPGAPSGCPLQDGLREVHVAGASFAELAIQAIDRSGIRTGLEQTMRNHRADCPTHVDARMQLDCMCSFVKFLSDDGRSFRDLDDAIIAFADDGGWDLDHVRTRHSRARVGAL